MISNEKELFDLIDEIFKPHGYTRRKDTWYKHTPECVCFFTIGKSFYSGKYGEAFGCFLKELDTYGKKEYPEYHLSHLRISLGFFIEKDIQTRVFDLDNREYVNNQREVIIKNLIESYVLPFLEGLSSKEGIKQMVVKHNDLKYDMKLVLKKALGIPYED